MEYSNSPSQNSSSSPSGKVVLGIMWVISILIAGYIGFVSGQSRSLPSTSTQKVLSTTEHLLPSPTHVPPVTPTNSESVTCKKSGFAQKWEYLTSYTIKEKDTLQGIIDTELKDSSRLNEVMQINGVGPLVVGSTLYLPPASIAKSSGKIKQVSGRLVKKDSVSWQLSFNGDVNGQGIIIPSYWYEEIADKDVYKLGDCVTVLFDDGFKVFSVTRSD